jgi:hypothetical protein
VSRSQMPFFVSLSLKFADTSSSHTLREYVCGGSAISDRWILTTASCFVNPFTGVLIRRNEAQASRIWVNSTNWTHSDGTQFTLDRVIFKDGYSTRTQQNDIALIHTAAAMAVTPIKYNANFATPSAGSNLRLYGFRHWVTSNVLTDLDLTDLGGWEGSCNPYATGDEYDRSSMLCAGNATSGGSVCSGDGGDPLTGWAGQRVLVGLVSWPSYCAGHSYPKVFTRVSHYELWIRLATGVRGNTATISADGTPAIMSATSTCRGHCSLHYHHTIQVTIRNSGFQSGSFTVGSSSLSRSARGGTIDGNHSEVVTLRANTRSASCAKVRVKTGRRTLASFNVRVNRGHCQP